MELSSRQKSFLKGLGQKLEVSVQVGKAGLSDAVVAQVRGVLERRELMKVRLPAGDSDGRMESARLLADAVSAGLVAMVGRNVLLYRANEKVAEPIRLPE